MLTKEIVIKHKEQLMATNIGKEDVITAATGGSTGDPLNFYKNRDYVDMGKAGMLRSFLQCGWKPGEMIAYFWGCSKAYYKKSKFYKRT